MKLLWEEMSQLGGDYRVLKFAHSMLSCDSGLSDDQFDDLKMFVYDELGPTAEMEDLFDRVEVNGGRFRLPAACKTNTAVV